MYYCTANGEVECKKMHFFYVLLELSLNIFISFSRSSNDFLSYTIAALRIIPRTFSIREQFKMKIISNAVHTCVYLSEGLNILVCIIIFQTILQHQNAVT